MADDKHTFELSVSGSDSMQLKPRARRKGQPGRPENASGGPEDRKESPAQPVTRDVVLRLIGLLKDV